MTQEKCRHVPSSGLSRQQVWSDWSDMLNEKKGPTAYSISFLVGFIEDLVFFAVSVFHVVL